MLFDALDMYETYLDGQASAQDESAAGTAFEALAQDFAERWMAHEPQALRARFEHELAGLIRETVEAGHGRRATRAA
jgi:hypothetical protein